MCLTFSSVHQNKESIVGQMENMKSVFFLASQDALIFPVQLERENRLSNAACIVALETMTYLKHVFEERDEHMSGIETPEIVERMTLHKLHKMVSEQQVVIVLMGNHAEVMI